MNKMLTLCFAAILLLAAQLTAKAQDDRRPFNPLAESVETAIKEQFPNWKRISIPPAQPNGAETFTDDVIIDQWVSNEAIVKVSILIHPSKEEAKKVLKEFVADLKPNENVPGLGDESHVWGIAKAVAFRKGRYSVYVTATPLINEEEEQLDSAAPPKETKYSKTFAQIVAKILKDL